METTGNAPGVSQCRVSQNAAQCCTQERITAKFACGSETNQDRQNDKCRRAEHIEHDKNRALRVGPAVGFHHAEQPHQQAGCDNRRNNRHKDIRQHARESLEGIEFSRRNIGGFGFARFADTGHFNKLGVHLVHQSRTKNDLNLSGVAETAFYAFHFFDSTFVDQTVVCQHQAQTCGAVCRAGNIVLPTQQRKQLSRDCIDVHRIP
ncbi:hypothetical protein SRABI106_04261 [Rahnella aquatilis]|nr:hypothetical protein SRABI106_04261 [Rahnella aquatilis]